MKMNSTVVLSPVLLFAAVAMNGCGHAEPTAEAHAASAPPARDVLVLTPGSITTVLRMPGELQAFQRVDLYAKVNSFVRELRVDVGSEVKAGDVLATLEAPEVGSQLEAAGSRMQAKQAQYTSSKATYDRLLQTSKTPGTISPNDLDIAFANMNAAKAQLDASRSTQSEAGAQRDYLTIRAPFSGIVTARNTNPGAYVGPSGRGSETPLFTVQEQGHLRLVVSVPEANVGNLHKGDTVHFNVRAFPGKIFTAEVARLAGALDDKLRAQRTEMDVINADKQLLPGMIAEVQLPLVTAPGAFVVPRSAVINSTTGISVVRAKCGKAQRVPVRIGLTADDVVQIFGPLTTGDTLVLKATDELKQGDALGTMQVHVAAPPDKK